MSLPVTLVVICATRPRPSTFAANESLLDVASRVFQHLSCKMVLFNECARDVNSAWRDGALGALIAWLGHVSKCASSRDNSGETG